MSIAMSNFIDVTNFNEDIVFNGLDLFDVVCARLTVGR